jgi:filamentous hemagglutinin
MEKKQSCIDIFKIGGGFFGGLKEAVKLEELEGWVDVHHIPSRESIENSKLYYVNGGKLDDGNTPAIIMDWGDHQITGSYGASAEANEYRNKQKELINNGKFIEAQKMDIDDIQKNFGSRYDSYIEQAVAHTKYLQNNGYL